jgi:transposase
MAEDEARCGLISWHQHCYHHVGQRPHCVQQRTYEWTWLYSAIEPASGEHVCLYLPRLNGHCYEIFLAELSRTYPDDLIILIRDNAPAHIKTDLVVPDNIVHLALPAYSPELNPVERFFLELRRALANTLFDSVDDLHLAITAFLQRFTDDPEALQLLTEFPWWWFALTHFKNCDIYVSG